MGARARPSDRLEAPRVAVLGPVAIGRPPHLRHVGGRVGRLLAGLAAAGRPKDLDELSEVVWDRDLPATHRSALHVHLGTLRRLLGEVGGGCAVVRSGSGYALDLGDWELDAALATDLLDGARAAIPDDPACAVELARQALGLWRGTPFSVDGEVVDAMSSHQIEAVLRDAEELVVEALLRTGRATAAEDAALRAVQQDPLRENRWGQLLRARYLAGRTADALATYGEARRTFVEELGIEPGLGLRDLEAAVLTHDAARLQLPTKEDPLPGPPPFTAALVGRSDELERLVGTVPVHRRVVILGPPGVGKSRLAAELVRSAAWRAVAWIDLQAREQGTVDSQLQRGREWVRAHPDGVLVLDNADEALAGAAALIAELAHAATRATVVVTSRIPLPVDLPVELLAPLGLPDPHAGDAVIEAAPSVQALRAALRELAPAVAVTSSEAAALCLHSGGLPVAIRLTAAAARALPVEDLLARPASSADDAIDRAARRVLDVVSPRGREAFLAVSVPRGDFDTELGADLAGLPVGELAGVLVELIDHGLVRAQPSKGQPYSVLEPLRAVADRVLGETGGHPEVLDRHADACIARARLLQQQAAAAAPGIEPRMRAHLPRCTDAMDHLQRAGDADRALALACWLDRPLYELGWWTERRELLHAALSIAGTPSVMRARAHAFSARGGPMHLFDMDEAEAAEAMALELGNHRLASYARHLRSIGLWWVGRTADAVEVARQAIDDLDTGAGSVELYEAQKHLGVALVLDGRADEGVAVQQDVLSTLRREKVGAFRIAHNLAYLGHCHRHTGDDTAALVDWSEARALCEEVGNRGTAIHVHLGLAEVAADRGDPDVVLLHVGEALDLLRVGRAQTYCPWAWTIALRAHTATGDLDAAHACARRAAEALPDAPPGESVRLATELAALARQEDELETAARLLGVARSTPDRRELPFPGPAEAARWAELARDVAQQVGAGYDDHVAAGARCTVPEAAGPLLST